MTDFTIAEDFPKNEIEFDQRFSKPKACYDYLFQQKWPDGFSCKKCGHRDYWLSSRNLYYHPMRASAFIDRLHHIQPGSIIATDALPSYSLSKTVVTVTRKQINVKPEI